MLTLTKILFPMDFSQKSVGALPYTKALAERFDADLILFHVMLPLQYEIGTLEFGGAAMGDLLASREGFARKQLDGVMADEAPGVRVHRILVEGDPAQKIIEYAHDEHVSLIVMPTHGYGPFRRFILGSVTAKVLHDADCPVWTGVHLEEAAAEAAVHVRSVLCAVDLGPQSTKALDWANKMALKFGAELTLAHSLPMVESKPGEYFDAEWRLHFSNLAKEEIDKLQRDVGSQAEVVIECGEASKVVHNVALQTKADLLVIGRGSAAGLFGRLRANAYSIIRESPCPVVSV